MELGIWKCLYHLGSHGLAGECTRPGGGAGLETGCWGEGCDSRAQLRSISPGLGPVGVS